MSAGYPTACHVDAGRRRNVHDSFLIAPATQDESFFPQSFASLKIVFYSERGDYKWREALLHNSNASILYAFIQATVHARLCQPGASPAGSQV